MSDASVASGGPDERLRVLDEWVAAGWLRDLDQVFAGFLAREAPDADPLLLLAAALASHQLGRGHVCLDLRATLAQPADTLAIPPEDKDGGAATASTTPEQLLQGVDLPRWQAALRHPQLVADGEGDTPLVLSGTRLYLRRYWQHEQSVRAAIMQRLAPADGPGEAAREVRPLLDALFGSAGPAADAGEPDWQKVSCALALRSRFTVITGGPGTGKTTTVVKLLALLQHLALADTARQGRRLRIRLAAPTGKAAARLNASIANAVQQLALDALPNAQEVRHAIPTEVSTVHRLLGSMGGSRRFRHDARNLLPLDVLVLDEASMVDLETMAAVLAALPPQARLVLLGDKDQLASVEAGSVLGELCRRADGGHYRESTRAWLHTVSGERIPDVYLDPAGQPLDQSVVKLRRSYRFDAHSGIGQLASAVNQGDARRVQKIRAQGRSDLAWVELAGGDTALRRLVLDGAGGASRQLELLREGASPVGYRHYLEVLAQRRPRPGAGREAYDAWAAAVLEAYGEFQLLCAVRKGPFGVERLNQRIASLLQAEGLVASAQGWYLGRPVMVTQNDYTVGLMNGDVGVTLELPTESGAGAAPQTLWRVAFRDSEGGIRWVLPSRLQNVETVYAMTVHKSQGSEFAHTALVLPDRASRVLTRELVYTAVTRAREWFTVAGPLSAGLLEAAVNRPTVRASGLLL